MPTSRFSPLALVVAGLACAFLAAPAHAQLDVEPSDLYLKAYLTMRDATQLEAGKKFDYAYEKYLEATELFDSVAHSYPTWNPHMVSFRRKKIREAITALKQSAETETGRPLGTSSGPIAEGQAMPSSAPVAPLEPPPYAPAVPRQLPPPDPNDPLPLPTRDPIVAMVPAAGPPPNVVAKTPGAENPAADFSPRNNLSINAATNHIERKFDELHTRIQTLDTEKQNLVYRLQSRETDLDKTRQELIAAQKEQKDLEQKLAESQSRLHINAATGSTELETLRDEVATVKAQLKIAKASLETSGKRTTALIAELDSARNEIDLLKEERSQLITERHQMTAILGEVGSGSSENVAQLMALNANLRRQLDTAREAAEKLAGERGREQEQIAALKAEIATVTDELHKVRADNESYRIQVAKLTEKLESASQDLAGTNSGAINAEALEENQMLRDIILRQLRQQARRQQAKELVMSEIAKLEINSKNLIDHIEDLAGSKIILTDKERALFRDSYVAPLLADADMHGTLLSSNETPPSAGSASSGQAEAPPLPSSDVKVEIARLSKEATASFAAEKFDKAESLYQDILKLDRQNIYSLCNLGTIKLRLGKHSEAEVLFNKALAYEPEHARSHFMLGVTYFQQEKLDEALESITHAAQLDSGNAWAHQYLGLIASHKGWIKRAEDEFKKAIAIHPGFAEAHFNLSVLYLKSEDSTRGLAEEHYHKALDHGAKPDPVMEKYLEG